MNPCKHPSIQCVRLLFQKALHIQTAADQIAGALLRSSGQGEPRWHRAAEDWEEQVLGEWRLVLQVRHHQDPDRRPLGVPLLPLAGGWQRGGAAKWKRWSPAAQTHNRTIGLHCVPNHVWCRLQRVCLRMIRAACSNSSGRKSWSWGERPTGKVTVQSQVTAGCSMRLWVVISKPPLSSTGGKSGRQAFPWAWMLIGIRICPETSSLTVRSPWTLYWTTVRRTSFSIPSVVTTAKAPQCKGSVELETHRGVSQCKVFLLHWGHASVSCVKDYLKLGLYVTRGIGMLLSCRRGSLHLETLTQTRSKTNCLHHAAILIFDKCEWFVISELEMENEICDSPSRASSGVHRPAASLWT